MDYSKLHWESDFMSYEIFGEGVDEYAIGMYRLKDFPQIIVYVHPEIGQIVDVILDEEWYSHNPE